MTIQKKIASIVRDQRGAGLVEYLMLVGLIAIICIAIFGEFGEAVSDRASQFKDDVSKLGTGGGG
jgi:Flp pilus assembly pilin Flp